VGFFLLLFFSEIPTMTGINNEIHGILHFLCSATQPDWKIRHFRDELPIKQIDFRMCSEEAGDEVKEN
jgi:hypothetical protein